ncbi:hypothetical protein HZB06_02420 [Candidatus Wolfebacteria bacterium]|nr:hypothetical protein [Candidatus Wolfebacteria bacterium]
MDHKIFRAYDIRGKYPEELNEKTIEEISPVLINLFAKKKIVIGRDVRLSSPKLYWAIIKRLSIKNGPKIIKGGIMTTPMLYFLVIFLKAGGGIMITASHNPKEYNGLKIVGHAATPISGAEIFKLLK